jgi:hypothetical protein
MNKRWIAIVNGFGLTLGDSVIGLQALRIARETAPYRDADVVTFRLQPERSAIIAELYAAAPHVAAVHPQPYGDIGRGPPAHFLDIRDFAFDPEFRGVAMIDFFLRRLGLDPGNVPSALKRNTWLSTLPRPAQPSVSEKYILVCPRAAMELRVMPDAVHARILRALGKMQGRPVLTQGTIPAGVAEGVVCVEPAGSLSQLLALVAGAALIVSTDTAMVHLADGLGVPTLAFFPTHRPEWRVRDYPLCRPVALEAELPPALEFARGPQDVVAAQASWFREGGLDWIDSELDGVLRAFGLASAGDLLGP